MTAKPETWQCTNDIWSVSVLYYHDTQKLPRASLQAKESAQCLFWVDLAMFVKLKIGERKSKTNLVNILMLLLLYQYHHLSVDKQNMVNPSVCVHNPRTMIVSTFTPPHTHTTSYSIHPLVQLGLWTVALGFQLLPCVYCIMDNGAHHYPWWHTPDYKLKKANYCLAGSYTSPYSLTALEGPLGL